MTPRSVFRPCECAVGYSSRPRLGIRVLRTLPLSRRRGGQAGEVDGFRAGSDGVPARHGETQAVSATSRCSSCSYPWDVTCRPCPPGWTVKLLG